MKNYENSQKKSGNSTKRAKINRTSHSFNTQREEAIKKVARDAGFTAVGISDLSEVDRSNRLFEKWLEAGKQGTMHYLHENREVRRDVRKLLEGARSAISVALNYYTDQIEKEAEDTTSSTKGTFSIYSRRGDYHRIVGSMLERVDRKLKEMFPGMRSLVCVDTKPVAERTLALQAGIGWLGKNTCVISPQAGSWIVLGELITDLSLEGDRGLDSLCGECTLCVDSCPTGALDEPFLLDARKCISYLTIESRGDFPEELESRIGRHVFGCDICEQVCPFNEEPKVSRIFMSEEENRLVRMSLDDLAGISNSEFERLTQRSVIGRCRAAGMRRNAKAALKNAER
jgi:epoxyqueuosine reductase